MSSYFLGLATYVTIGFVSWWWNFGRFEEYDVVVMVRVMSGREHRDVKYVGLGVALQVLFLWPLALVDVLLKYVVFKEEVERQTYRNGLRMLQEEISQRFRRKLFRELRGIRERFRRRGLKIAPLPKEW